MSRHEYRRHTAIAHQHASRTMRQELKLRHARAEKRRLKKFRKREQKRLRRYNRK